MDWGCFSVEYRTFTLSDGPGLSHKKLSVFASCFIEAKVTTGTVPCKAAQEYYTQRTVKGGLLLTEATCINTTSHGWVPVFLLCSIHMWHGVDTESYRLQHGHEVLVTRFGMQLYTARLAWVILKASLDFVLELPCPWRLVILEFPAVFARASGFCSLLP